ncbi:serine protease Do [Bradyrhizobium sp. AZCC 1719]
MVRRNLSFSCRRASIMVTTIASMIASGAQTEIMNPPGQAPSADRAATLMRQVADTGGGGGPGKFPDLAEKVGPAVIGVSSKAAPNSKTLPDQPLEFDTPDESPSKKGMPAPGGADQGKAPKTIEMITIGSGFFISPDGFAVTSSHIVEDDDTAEIRTNDGKTYTAKVVGTDSLSGLALIKVEGRNDFSYVKVADQPPRVGDWVLTAGNAFGLGGTVTAGIVSARERNIETGSAEDFIQIDASINKGDSGGPSFDARGEVIGVNGMIFSPSGGSVGVAFAIPADTVKAVIPQLKDKGIVTRGSIGARVQSVTPDLADSLGVNNVRGAIVASVQDNGPAAKAGLRSGDVITSLEGEPIKNANEFSRKIHAMAPGASIRLAMLRDRQENSLSVTLSQLPNQPKPPARIPR